MLGGGVTVNLIVGFLIYMMVLFVWGKETSSSGKFSIRYAAISSC